MEEKLVHKNKDEFIINNEVIQLSVTLENLPSKLEIEGSTFFLRNSFHVSVVCIEKIIEKHNVSIPDFESKVINDFSEFVKTNDIEVLEYNDFKFVEKNEKKSLVVMCKVSNLDKFFARINKKYGLKIEYPPTHVTLYTLESQRGIFLTDADDIKNFTKPIPNPIGKSL